MYIIWFVLCFWVPYMELSCFRGEIIKSHRRKALLSLKKNYYEINGQNKISSAFICHRSHRRRRCRIYTRYLRFSLVDRSISRSICVCCTDLHSFHLTRVFTICIITWVCFVFLLLSNQHDWYTTTFLLLRKIYIFITLFQKKNKSFTAHHQFVINIHLVSSVLCLWDAHAHARIRMIFYCFFLISYIFVKVNFRVHIHKLILTVHYMRVVGRRRRRCLFSAQHLKLNLWTLVADSSRSTMYVVRLRNEEMAKTHLFFIEQTKSQEECERKAGE